MAHSSPETTFPIIVIAVIGILSITLLLVAYSIFVIKCCLIRNRVDLLERFSLPMRPNRDTLITYSTNIKPRGLEESVIRSIPIQRFNKHNVNSESFAIFGCAICLNDFMENEKLRIIPNCNHLFHIDCIDIWLQTNPNCPICRTSISTNTLPANQKTLTLTSSSSPQNPYPVIIELNNQNLTNQGTIETQRRLNSDELSEDSEQRKRKGRKLVEKVWSMGDECIDIRCKDDDWLYIELPIRRSFSMDSFGDREIWLAVGESVLKKSEVVNSIGGSSCSRVNGGSFFSFGNGGRGSRNSVFPF